MITQSEVVATAGRCRKIWEDEDNFGVERINCWCGAFVLRAVWMSSQHWQHRKERFTTEHSPVFKKLKQDKSNAINTTTVG